MLLFLLLPLLPPLPLLLLLLAVLSLVVLLLALVVPPSLGSGDDEEDMDAYVCSLERELPRHAWLPAPALRRCLSDCDEAFLVADPLPSTSTCE